MIGTSIYSQTRNLANPNNIVTPQAAGPTNPPGDYNTLSFSYDTAGNQTKRQLIYIAAKPGREDNPDAFSKDVPVAFTKSDEFADISYFPNPVRQELFLRWKNVSPDYVDRMELYTSSGQLIAKINDLRAIEDKSVDFNNVPSGFYNLLLIYGSGNTKNLKIVKQ